MKKKYAIGIIVVFILLSFSVLILSNCSVRNRRKATEDTIKNAIVNKEYSVDSKIYVAVIEDLMKQDEALNNNMQYIAIDFDTFTNITEETKEDILNYLKTYNVEVIEANYEQLKEQNRIDDFGNLYGILITLQDMQTISETNVVIKMMKHRSPLGAIMPTYDCKLEGDMWILEIKETAIS